MNLGDLIITHKSDRSYTELARDCGGVPKAARLQQLATKPLRNFPDPPTIKALARGLRVSETAVVLAAAESLGLNVRTAVPAIVSHLPEGVDQLEDQQLSEIAAMARRMVTENRERESQRETVESQLTALKGLMMEFRIGLDDGVNGEFRYDGTPESESRIDELIQAFRETEPTVAMGALANIMTAVMQARDHAMHEHPDGEHHIVVSPAEDHNEKGREEHDRSPSASDTGRPGNVTRLASRDTEVSEPDETVRPAALDPEEGVDESPGGSEQNEP